MGIVDHVESLLTLQCGGSDQQWGEVLRIRLQYDDARKQVSDLQQQLGSIEEQMIPGQNDSDKDRSVDIVTLEIVVFSIEVV